MCDFVHLHSHTQYSLLDGAADIDTMIKKAKADGMVAASITDHGNMFGVFKFFSTCKKHGVKPILGCEVYVVEDRFNKKFTREVKDKRYHQLLLAKNETGYQNLMKIVSAGYTDGLYMDFPRVDRGVIKQYKEGLIASTCCIGAEVPQTIIHNRVMLQRRNKTPPPPGLHGSKSNRTPNASNTERGVYHSTLSLCGPTSCVKPPLPTPQQYNTLQPLDKQCYTQTAPSRRQAPQPKKYGILNG